jgi:hypothetical protein
VSAKKFSYGVFAALTLGAGMIVLVLSGLLVIAFNPGPQVGLAIALGGIIGSIAAMGVVANRLLDRANEDPEDNKSPDNR